MASPEAADPTTTWSAAIATSDGLVLRGDGLGAVDFGDPADEVMTVLVGSLGAPDHDSFADCIEGIGYSCDEYLRFVGWEEVSLDLILSDVNPYREGAALVGWTVHWPWDPESAEYGVKSPLRTIEGIGVGSTVAEMETAFGERLAWSWDDCAGRLYFQVDDYSIRGWMDVDVPEGQLPEPESRVTEVEAGVWGDC